MKLLKLKIETPEGFRSLQQGFEINFHLLEDTEAMEEFRPFCFAGLNGSGKSNVLEALSAIFYHLEICVARFLPESMRNSTNFKRNVCSPDAFTLEYLIGQHNGEPYVLEKFHKVTIHKEVGSEPTMYIQEYPFNENVKKINIDLNPIVGGKQCAPGKSYLPDHIIGYSSGENETLSLPYIKSRLVHLDEYRQAVKEDYENFNSNFEKPENSLIYIDNNMSQAVLLACLLFESEKTLQPISDEIGIQGIRSFRMNINLHRFNFQKENENILHILERPNREIEKLKKCATSWFSNKDLIWLDFFVNDSTKQAFKDNFNNSFELFQLFQLLYELNNHFIDEKIAESIYQSKGVYTDAKLPAGIDTVFHFLEYKITKKMKGSDEIKDLLLREFSDGEHQFLHTMGICLLLKDKRALLLLDEPETHFNPSWRAKFIKILNDSITLGNQKDHINGNFNVHYLKDILLTSHSPFIISDCMPNNVILFEKDDKGVLSAKKASELGIDTYGTSVNLITNRIFKSKETIGKYALSKLYSYKKRFQSTENKQNIIDELNEEFGDSIEKLLLIKEMTNNE